MHTYAISIFKIFLMIRHLKFGKEIQQRTDDEDNVRKAVEGIIKAVEERGDVAFGDYSLQFGKWDPTDLRLYASDIENARKLLTARELQDPDEVNVIGFDEVPQAAWGAYRLTTVAQSLAKMVDFPIELLLEQLPQSGHPLNVVSSRQIIEHATVRRACVFAKK
jgi:DNA-binding LacI/PurR family transcriptional regulator